MSGTNLNNTALRYWPEYPKGSAPSRERSQDALLRLAEGPPSEDPPQHYRVGVSGGVFDFPLARWIHFPGGGSPEFLLVWTPWGSHCFSYHEIDYAFVVKGK